MGKGTGTSASFRIVTAAVAALSLLAAAGCSESEDVAGDGSTTTQLASEESPDGSIQPSAGDGETVISRFEGAQWFQGDVPAASAADDSLEPIRIGFINVDSAPMASMPELHTAVDAAAEMINKELGGVDGHPVEIVPCLLSNALSPEEAAGCARQMVDAGVVAVLGGIGLSTGAALAVLADNGIPWVGGIPVNRDEMESPLSFQFSGGSPGAFTAFAEQAVNAERAEKVAVVYGDYPSIKEGAVDYGAAVAEALGAEVTEVPYPLVSQDYATPVQKAVEGDPDAILVAAADLSCAPIMQALVDLQTTAKIYMVGSCADQKVLDSVGPEKILGINFNIENRLDQTADDLADTEIYTLAMEKYAPGTTPKSAATVSFKAAMNLWAVLDSIGADVTADQVVEAFRAAKDAPSFDGHPYTCDGQQIPDLPSMCASQQVIVELSEPDLLTEASDGWVDVPTVLRETINKG